ncbi:MAG: hypothetical protein KGL98_01135 [Gammaproteobacteria bacterium]|nr:hypothetical protein [Gammaproteobacteria bacterium]MBU6509240.1 hypothetical protein [Gammaproteobacteria bacterium]MDE1983758.1 hypothetical protein [Gammaproteobacteria bacterium]MDE2107880.1 hypothetical protein [Gammaproteobacteria bacterium]MDE2459827.1 hypothetical protein [Gammaproteobacteria bacterium]
MTEFSRISRLMAVGAACAVFTAALAACSHGSSQNAKKVIMACLALPDTAAGQIMNEKLVGLQLSGAGSPVHICQYVNDNNDTAVLLQIFAFKGKDAASDLAEDAATQKGLFKNNIVPAKINPASGFGPGAFFLDNTLSLTASAVQLHFISGANKFMVQINNPKDFATGEKQAAALAQETLKNIENGSAFQPVTTNS